jgi:hypothetical protein
MTTPIEVLRKVISADDCMKDGMQGAGRILNNAIDNARAALAAHDARQKTTGHCLYKKQPGGCHLHNLQCGYPACDEEPPIPAARQQDEIIITYGHCTGGERFRQYLRDPLPAWAYDVKLEAQQQEPVATIIEGSEVDGDGKLLAAREIDWYSEDIADLPVGTPLYTIPSQDQADAARWRWWRLRYTALTGMDTARFAGLDLSKVYVNSPEKMDAVTDAAMKEQP